MLIVLSIAAKGCFLLLLSAAMLCWGLTMLRIVSMSGEVRVDESVLEEYPCISLIAEGGDPSTPRCALRSG